MTAAMLALYFGGGLASGALALLTAILATPTPAPALALRCSACRRSLAAHEFDKARAHAPAFLTYDEVEELNAVAMAMATAATGRPPEGTMVVAHARNYLALATMMVEHRREGGRTFDLHRQRIAAAWERVHEKLGSAEGARAQTETLVRLGVAQSERLR